MRFYSHLIPLVKSFFVYVSPLITFVVVFVNDLFIYSLLALYQPLTVNPKYTLSGNA
jgi:hypothetical protein